MRPALTIEYGSLFQRQHAVHSARCAWAKPQGESMTFRRRRFLQLAAGAAALPALPRFAWAQAYPSRPIHLVIGFTPGAATDVIGRLFAKAAEPRLGQQIVVENRPGAA